MTTNPDIPIISDMPSFQAYQERQDELYGYSLPTIIWARVLRPLFAPLEHSLVKTEYEIAYWRVAGEFIDACVFASFEVNE